MEGLKLKYDLGRLKRYVYEGVGIKTYRIESKRLSEMGSDDLLSVTSDKVFKMMFQTEETKKYACYLISLIFDIDVEEFEKNFRLYNTEFKMDNVRESNERGDFVGEYRGRFFSIEMNNTNVLERNEEYVNRLAGSFIGRKGGKYKEVVQININNFTTRGIEETIKISELSDGKYKRAQKTFVDIYLPNMNRKYKEGGVGVLTKTEREILAMFISKKKEMEELGKEEKIIMDFKERLEWFRENKELHQMYSHEQAERDAYREEGREEGFDCGQREGLEKGRKLGIEEKQVSVALSMLDDGMPLEKICRYTDIPLDKLDYLRVCERK